MSWEKFIEWDRKYYMHIASTTEEWDPFVVDKVEGSYIISEGKKFLDFTGGWFNINLGQRHPEVVKEIIRALDRYGWVPENFVTPYKAEAAKLIVEDLLGPDRWAGRVRFLNSGSEAVDAAIIIAKLYTNQPNILSFRSYHGSTIGSGSSTGTRVYRGALTSPTGEVREVPHSPIPGIHFGLRPYCYRCPLNHEYPDCKIGSKLACIQVTEDLINAIGPQTFAACITDVVWGAPSIIPPKEFIPQLRRMLRENAILWIDDEVVCGFGRLGKWFGYQLYDDITPDIMTIGKGISSSHLPAAGVVISKGISDFFDKFRWHHYSTFAAHPVCMAAVVANLKVMIKEKIPERASKIGKYLGEKLRQLEDGHKCVGLVNGIGLFWILEIVKNKETKEPFEKEDRDARYIGDISTKWPNLIVKQKGLEKGVILGGFAPNTLKIAPALTVTEEDVDKGVEALDYALSYIDKMCE